MARLAYSTDLTDEQWALIEPFLHAWKAKRVSPSGYTGCYDLREIINAIFYQNRTCCQWHLLPHDLPPESAVGYYFGLWRDEAPTKPFMICCAARRGSRPAGPRTRPRSSWTLSRSGRRTTSRPLLREKMLGNGCPAGSGAWLWTRQG